MRRSALHLSSTLADSYAADGITPPGTRGSKNQMIVLPESASGEFSAAGGDDSQASVFFAPIGPTARGAVRCCKGACGGLTRLHGALHVAAKHAMCKLCQPCGAAPHAGAWRS